MKEYTMTVLAGTSIGAGEVTEFVALFTTLVAKTGVGLRGGGPPAYAEKQRLRVTSAREILVFIVASFYPLPLFCQGSCSLLPCPVSCLFDYPKRVEHCQLNAPRSPTKFWFLSCPVVYRIAPSGVTYPGRTLQGGVRQFIHEGRVFTSGPEWTGCTLLRHHFHVTGFHSSNFLRW